MQEPLATKCWDQRGCKAMQETFATKCWDQRGCKRCKSHLRQSVGIREAVNDARAIGDKVLGSERL